MVKYKIGNYILKPKLRTESFNRSDCFVSLWDFTNYEKKTTTALIRKSGLVPTCRDRLSSGARLKRLGRNGALPTSRYRTRRHAIKTISFFDRRGGRTLTVQFRSNRSRRLFARAAHVGRFRPSPLVFDRFPNRIGRHSRRHAIIGSVPFAWT